MKRITGTFLAFSLLILMFSCGENENVQSVPTVSEISVPSVSEEISEEFSADSSAEETSETSEETSFCDDPTVPVYGKYGKKYFELIESGTYCRRTVESRTIGGEAVPYTVTVYRSPEAVNVVIEESYGMKTTYIIRDGRLITLDGFQKKAYITEYDGTVYEKPLWNGVIKLKSEGTQTLFQRNYQYETYKDSDGFEFTVFYSEGVPERYRSFDKNKLDTIVIDFTVSDDMSGAVFGVPENYSIADYTK